ncbi:MAG TPA: amidohydrolase family protein [Acidimicrobiales bacterium]|nr:amidohydrolase family protein [Acidimicrobiales bacterium]
MADLVIRNATIVDGTGAPAFAGDIVVDGDTITSIEAPGTAPAGAREIDAEGKLAAPGWVDVHTHYDGQVTWDPEVTPSSWHGATTIVMGNCGVGFAPARRGDDEQALLIELMESVEDIPGTALHEGIDWQWESFPEYLDAVDAMPRVLDVAAQVPHAALRAYVMGARAHDDDATSEDVAMMAKLTAEAIECGAVGFSTSRTVLHRSKYGLVPGTTAPGEEVVAIAEAIGKVGKGVIQIISDRSGHDGPERDWMVEIARSTGRPVTFLTAQSPFAPEGYRDVLDHALALQEEGVQFVPQVGNRPTGMLFGLQSSFHPFITHPTYRALRDLPLERRVAELRKPEVCAALLSEEGKAMSPLMSRWDQMFQLGDPCDYEPPREASVAATAEREGRRPEEVALDWLLERDGKALFFAPLASYVHHNFDAIREMVSHPATVLGLSDGGAHCGLICDASMTTFNLTHWARDRTRGAKLPLEFVVQQQTQRTAHLYGFTDRGELKPGKRADINVIDFDNLHIHAPEMIFDLPAGGRRLVQRVDGYDATVCAGKITFENGKATGERPGRLVRV